MDIFKRKGVKYILLFFIVVAACFLAFYTRNPTGYAVFEVQNISYIDGIVRGVIDINIKEGELIPQDAIVSVAVGDEIKNFYLKDLATSKPLVGDYYSEDKDISGSGEGFGAYGTKIVYPSVSFELKINQIFSDDSSYGEVPIDEEILPPAVLPDEEEELISPVDNFDEVTDLPSPDQQDAVSSKDSVSDSSEDSLTDSSSDSASSSSDVASSGVITGQVVLDNVLVDGKVSKDGDFVFLLEPDQTASLVSDSVYSEGKKLSDDVLQFKEEEGKVTVSTNYSTVEQGFGKEYLGKTGQVISLDVTLSDFHQPREKMIVSLSYQNVTLAKSEAYVSLNDSIISKINLSTEDQNLSLIKEIPTQRVKVDQNLNLNLGNYFEGATTYSLIANNVSFNLISDIMEIIPAQNFKGAVRAKVIAFNSDGSKSLESNEFSILVSSGAVNISTSHSPIKLGEEVKWTKNISLENPENISIELPKLAEEISISKINPETNTIEEANNENVNLGLISGQVVIDIKLRKEPRWISNLRNFFSSITGRVVDDQNSSRTIDLGIEETKTVEIQDNATQYTIEYTTPAPVSAETSTDYGKEVVISASDDLGYTDVLSYSNIPEKYSVGQEENISLYWVENNSYLPFDAYDMDADGKLDYIEWVTPHLSNQTFEIILVDLSYGEVLHYSMDDNSASTDVVDSSGNGFTGTAQQNTENLSVSGKINTALSFDGSGDYISASGSGFRSSAQTISFWVYHDSVGGYSPSYFLYGSPYVYQGARAALDTDGYVRYISTRDGGSWTTSLDSPVLSAEAWHHIVFVDGSGDQRLYVDGILVDNASAIGDLQYGDESSFYIGTDTLGSNLDGKLDDVRIYNRSLSVAEISTLYNSGSGTGEELVNVSLPTPVAYYKMDDNATDTNVVDYFGNYNGVSQRNTNEMTSSGAIDSSLNFNGVGDYVDLGNNAALKPTNEFTFSTWIKTSSDTNQMGLFESRSAHNNEGANVIIYNNVVRLLVSTSGSSWETFIDSVPFSANKWHLVTATWKSGEQALYIDGVKQINQYEGGGENAEGTIYWGVDDLKLGNNFDPSYYLNAKLDDVRIYDVALTSGQVAAMYEEYKPLESNTAPIINSVSLTTTDPELNDTSTNLVSSVDASDDEGNNITLAYNWYKDEILNATTLITDGLVAYYPLNNDTFDYYGSYDGVNNGATPTENGKIGGGMSFDGSSNYIDYGNPAALDITGNEITISAWIKTSQILENEQFLVSKYYSGGAQGSYLFDMYQGRVGLIIYGAPSVPWSNTIVADGNWHHIVGTYDGETVKTYVDGFEDGSLSYSGTISSVPQKFLIGAKCDNFDCSALSNSPFLFNGSLDEVMVFNRTLSESEIQELYTGGLAGGNELTNLFAGVWKLGVKAGDYGLWSSESLSNEISISQADITPPSINITSPVSDNYYSSSSFGISYSFDDAASCYWSTDNSSWVQTTCGVVDSGGYAPSEGINNLYIKVSDLNNNDNYANVTFFYDTTLPSIQYDEGTPNDQDVSNSGNISVFFSGSDSSPFYTFLNYDNSLLGWWRFEGNANDESGNGLDGSNYGATFINNGKFGSATNFETAGTCISVADSDKFTFGNKLSISFWIKPSSGAEILSKRAPASGNGIAIQYDAIGHRIGVWLSSGGGWDIVNDLYSDSESVPLDIWSHFTVTYNASDISLYVNGVLQSNIGKSEANIQDNSNPVCFGGSNCQQDFYVGALDDLMIFNRSLSESEVQALYSGSAASFNSYFNNGGSYHPFQAFAVDAVGNKNDAGLRTVSIEGTAPSVSINFPQEGVNYGPNTWQPSISWDDSILCEYSYDGINYHSIDCGNAGSDLPDPVSAGYSEGVNTLYIRGSDNLNNSGTLSVGFNWDQTTPVISIPSIPTEGATYGPNNWVPGINWDDSVLCEYSYDDITYSAFSCGSDLPDPVSAGYTEGENRVYLRGTDSANNVGTLSVGFTWDQTNPLIGIDSPVYLGNYGPNNWAPNINWDDSILCEYSYDDATYTRVDCGNSGSDINSPITDGYSEGAITLYLRGYDGGDNLGAASINFVTHSDNVYSSINTDVTTCGTILEAGTYTLQNDVSASTDCFIVGASNVILELNGKIISGNHDAVGKGVYVNGYNSITVQNGYIMDFDYVNDESIGIVFDSSDSNALYNLNFISNYGDIKFSNSDGNLVDNVQTSYTGLNSLVLYLSNYSILRNIIISGPPASMGAYGFVISASDNTIIDNVSVNLFEKGFAVLGSSFNNFSNLFTTNNMYGMIFESASNYNIINNLNSYGEIDALTFSGSSNMNARSVSIVNVLGYGLKLYQSSSNIIEDLNSQSGYGLLLQESSNNYLNRVYSTGASDGLYLNDADSNIFENINLTSNSIDDLNFDLAESSNNLFKNYNIGTYKIADGSLTGIAFESTDYGIMNFSGGITSSGQIRNFNEDIILSSNLAHINSEGNSGLNVSAQVTLYNTGVNSNPIVLKGGNYISITPTQIGDGDDYTFNADSWSNYSIADGTNGRLVTTCRTIDEAGVYILQNDITGVSADCFTITTNNVELNGNGKVISGLGSFYGIYASGVSGLIIHNFGSIDSFDSGIKLDSVSGANISNNQFSANNYGIYLPSSSPGNLIYGNNFYSINNIGLGLDSSDNEIISNSFSDSASYAILVSASQAEISGNTYSNNGVDYGTSVCLNFDGATSAIVLADISTSEAECFTINSNNFNLNGNGKTITGVGMGPGVLASGLTGINISNLLITNFLNGIFFMSTTNSIIADNSISNSGSGGFGIYFDSGSSSNTIQRNSISSMDAYGIYVDSVQTDISSNTFSENTVDYGTSICLNFESSSTNATLIGPVSASGNCFTINSNNFNFDGNGQTVSGISMGNAISASGVSGLNIHNFDITRFENGLYLTSISNSVFANLISVDAFSHPIIITSQSDNNYFINNSLNGYYTISEGSILSFENANGIINFTSGISGNGDIYYDIQIGSGFAYVNSEGVSGLNVSAIITLYDTGITSNPVVLKDGNYVQIVPTLLEGSDGDDYTFAVDSWSNYSIGTPSSLFAGGTGTAEDPYQITTWNQLNLIRENLSAYYVLNNNLSSNDGDYSGRGDNWQPIGELFNPFGGEFNGNGYTISDLIIGGSDNAGLFSAIQGNLSNLNFVNSSFDNAGVSYFGILAGVQLAGNIENCSVSGNIAGFNFIGGLVGMASGNIHNSVSYANVSGASQIGGLVGNQQLGSTIFNCSAQGLISSSWNAMGGLAGEIGGVVDSSYSIPPGLISTAAYIGGLGGLIGPNAIINNSYTIINSTLSASSDFGTLLGGVISGAIIDNCSSLVYPSASISGAYTGFIGHFYYGSVTIQNSWIAFDNPDYGRITLFDVITEYNGNLLDLVSLQNNSAYYSFSSSANITLYGIGDRGFTNPTIFKDGEVCTDCYNFTALNEENVSFSVTGIGNYSIGETPFDGICTSNITRCCNINSSGSYSLMNNLSASGDCIIVGADSVSLNGNGFTITGNVNASGVGQTETGDGNNAFTNLIINNTNISGNIYAIGADISDGYFGFGGNGGSVTLVDSNATLIDATGGLGARSGDGGQITLINSNVVNVISLGREGQNWMRGDEAGNAGSVIVNYSQVSLVNTSAGYNGLSPVKSGGSVIAYQSNISSIDSSGAYGNNGDGGVAGNIYLTNSNCSSITAKGGSSHFDNGGNGGNLTLVDSLIQNSATINLNGGEGNSIGENGKIILTNSGFYNSQGKIIYDSLSTENTSLDLILDIENNYVYVNSSNYLDYNVSANISLYGIGERGFENPAILKDGAVCTDCSNFTALNEETVIFNISSWSNYSIGETPFDGICTSNITRCCNINSSGSYSLMNNLSASGDCIIVGADSVSLNGNGKTIEGNGSGYAISAINLLDVNISDVNVSHFGNAGIYLEATNNSIIENVNSSNSGMGIELIRSHYNNLENTITYSNEYRGIDLEYSTYNNITNATSYGNTRGVYVGGSILDETGSNLFVDANFSSNINAGVFLDRTQNNTFINLQSYGNQTRALASSNWSYSTGNDLIYINENGEIAFSDLSSSINSSNITFGEGQNIQIGEGYAFVNSSAVSGLNISANVTLNVDYDGSYPALLQKITKDGVECDVDCVNYTVLTEPVVTFSVESWSNYSVGKFVRSKSEIPLTSGWNMISITTENNETSEDVNVSVSAGWNLIGYSSDVNASLSNVDFVNSSGISDSFNSASSKGKVQRNVAYLTGNSNAKKYSFVGKSGADSKLSKGKGYWVYANQSGNLTLKGVRGSAKNESYKLTDLMFRNSTGAELNITRAVEEGWTNGFVWYWNPSKNRGRGGWDYYFYLDNPDISSWNGYFVEGLKENITLLRQN